MVGSVDRLRDVILGTQLVCAEDADLLMGCADAIERELVNCYELLHSLQQGDGWPDRDKLASYDIDPAEVRRVGSAGLEALEAQTNASCEPTGTCEVACFGDGIDDGMERPRDA